MKNNAADTIHYNNIMYSKNSKITTFNISS